MEEMSKGGGQTDEFLFLHIFCFIQKWNLAAFITFYIVTFI